MYTEAKRKDLKKMDDDGGRPSEGGSRPREDVRRRPAPTGEDTA
jgi:hypothetical protein